MSEKATPGRPRKQEANSAILSAAVSLMEEVGFKAVTMEAIAERSGFTKTTIYRRWPNTWAVFLDALMAEVETTLRFEKKESLIETIRADMHALVGAYKGRAGRLFAPLLGVSQFNAELREALLTRYIASRRVLGHRHFAEAKERGEIRADADVDAAIDALYGGLVYRLLVPHAPLDERFADALIETVFRGL